MTRRTLPILPSAAVILASIACNGDSSSPTDPDGDPSDNVAPTVAPVADQTVVRNTLEPRSRQLELSIEDPDDDSFQVEVTPDDPSVIAARTLDCGSGSCALTLTPSPEQSTTVEVGLTVTDGSGGEAQTSFRVDVVPLRVTDTGDSGTGSLRQTVTTAEPGDVIGFDTEGAFDAAQTIGLIGQLVIEKTLTIEGPGADRLTVSGGDAARVFKVTGGATVAIHGLTIADGRAPLEEFMVEGSVETIAVGGGVFVEAGSKLTLSACDVSNNLAGTPEATALGGGIANFEGTLEIDGCDVMDNAAPTGGGVANFTFGGNETVTTIRNSVVSGNTATTFQAGGILNLLGSVVVEASEITGNTASSHSGGGIANAGVLVIRSGSLISENTAGGTEAFHGGGGIDNIAVGEGTSATITGSTVEANHAVVNGGGIRNEGTLEILSGSAIIGNTADDQGGAIYNDSVPGFGVGGVMIDDARIGGESAAEGNRASEGGGIYNVDGTIELANGSVISSNLAELLGGGAYNADEGTLTLRAGTSITANTAEEPAPSGGGVYNTGTLENDGDISGNTPDDIAP